MTAAAKVINADTVTKQDLEGLSPKELREIIRQGRWAGGTEGLARGYAQANLIILPKDVALEFTIFCLRNPKPCPIVEITDPGSPMVTQVAQADLRTDLPRYCVYKDGKLVDQPTDVTEYWRDDLVGFLIGCSYSFEEAMINAGIPLRHQQEDKIVSVYTTNVDCVPCGQFAGPMVVSMRPIKRDQLVRSIQVTSRFPATHGAPVHVGDPSLIGVDLAKTDFETGVFDMAEDDVPVFWGCGGTPQAVALASKIDFMITHKIGHLFVTDKLSESIAAI
jgi:uncharacterized protein YcsI (UPF0317 family)